MPLFRRAGDDSNNEKYSALRIALQKEWRTHLGVENANDASNFYAVGGTSLIAARVLAAMPCTADRPRLSELIACQTFSDQLQVFTTVRRAPTAKGKQDLSLRQRLRLEQIAAQVKARGAADVQPLALVAEINGPVNIDELRLALSQVVRRHDVLNLGFVNHNWEIGPFRTGAVDVWAPDCLDLSQASAEDARSQIWQLVEESAKEGLPFDRSCLLLGAVVKVRNELTIAVLVIDHLVCDGGSLDILFGDLAEFYSARIENRRPCLPELTIGAQDAVVRADLYGQADVTSRAAEWKRLLDGYSMPPSFDLERGVADRDYRGTVPSEACVLEFQLSADSTTGMKKAYRSLGVPPLAVMLGAVYLAAHIVSGSGDICIVNPYSRRYAVGALGVVNNFSELSLIRIQYRGNDCPCRLPLKEIARLAASAQAAASEAELPFAQVMRTISGENGWSPAKPEDETPAPWLWCNYMDSAPRSIKMGYASATMLQGPNTGLIPIPNLKLYVEDVDENIEVQVIVPEGLYRMPTVEQFSLALEQILLAFGDESAGHAKPFGSMLCRAVS